MEEHIAHLKNILDCLDVISCQLRQANTVGSYSTFIVFVPSPKCHVTTPEVHVHYCRTQFQMDSSLSQGGAHVVQALFGMGNRVSCHLYREPRLRVIRSGLQLVNTTIDST